MIGRNRFLKYSLIVFGLLTCGVLFRGSLYRVLFYYETIDRRTTYGATSDDLINYLDRETLSYNPSNINDVIERSLQLTSDQLNFQANAHDIDPNNLFRARNAHCVGYSAFFATTCNYLLRKYGYDRDWRSEHLVGQIHFCGVNIHHFFDSSFFADHDFNEIHNKITGEKYFVDPTINDYFLIDFVAGEPGLTHQ
jgi:hypothetical protein